jgi:hypothetical protein
MVAMLVVEGRQVSEKVGKYGDSMVFGATLLVVAGVVLLWAQSLSELDVAGVG